MIIRYDSTAALRADYIAAFGQRGEDKSGWNDTSWYGGESTEATLRKALVGDTTLVSLAEAELEKLDATIETPRRMWERSPAGAFCVVPDVLAGLPTPMRRQIHVRDEAAPITVLVCTTSSAAVSASTLRRRGIVILALVMALARVRPVSLQQLTILHGRQDGETIITSEINTSPLDLATACYVLTSAGFARRLTYGLGRHKNNFNGGWPSKFQYGSSEPYYDYLKQKLAVDPTKCLMIKAAELHDELLLRPTEWIQEQIKKFTADQEEFVL